MMKLDKLFEMQKVLKERIGYTGEDRFNKLILALLVEIGECANEWRGFKFWSKNQEPKTEIKHLCPYCDKGEHQPTYQSETITCEECEGDYVLGTSNPLLEEYVDGLHFILEVGLDFELNELDIELLEDEIKFEPYIRNNIEEQFTAVFYFATRSTFNYSVLFNAYVGLGEMLGFTWNQIEQAYMDKNKINHERQDSGY